MSKTKTILFLLVPAAFLFIVLEVVGRIIYPFDPWERAQIIAERDPRRPLWENRDVDPQVILSDIYGMEKRYVSFLGWIGAPDVNLTTLQINSLGFRDSAVHGRTPNEFRILILGGSAAWGWGASSNERTPSGALEQLLNAEAAPDVSYRVMNGAHLAWSSLQERVVLTELFEEFDPDLVISLTGFNDVISVQSGGRRDLLRMEYSMLEEAVNNHLKPMGTLTAARKVAGTLGIWRIVIYFRELIQRRVGRHNSRIDYDSERAKYGIPKVVDRYISMGNYASRRGAKYLLALQPDIYTSGKALTAEEANIKEWLDARNGENFDETFSRYRSDLVEVASQPNEALAVVDLRNMFDASSETMFSDDSHFNDDGYREIAMVLEENILRSLEHRHSEMER